MIRRFLAPVAVGLLAAFAYHILNDTSLNKTPVSVNEFYGEQFFSVFATLYAIITALVLVKGIETFDNLSRCINKEAAKIRSINTYFLYYDATSSSDNAAHIASIRNILLRYVETIIKRTNAKRSIENDGLIAQCVERCSKIECEDYNDRIALGEIMRGLDELRMIRSDRISAAQQSIPSYLIYMLAVMTIALTLPFFLHHQSGPNFNYYVIFMLSTFGSFIFFLLNDINRPYTGSWRVDFGPFGEAHKEIQNALSDPANSSNPAHAHYKQESLSEIRPKRFEEAMGLPPEAATQHATREAKSRHPAR